MLPCPLIRDNNGTYIVLGPSSNLSLLYSIRQIVNSALGPWPFTEERPDSDLVDEAPTPSANTIDIKVEPQRPSEADAHYYIHWYSVTTTCVFDLFELEELEAQIVPWLSQPATADAQTCINFLVLAIGAQCAPGDHDVQAAFYFTYGHNLASTECLGTANHLTVQIYCLISLYLLNATRPIAAKMHLSVAIQTAHSLGIHQPDLLALFPSEEASNRERLWKVLRVLDLFLSTFLGQQPSTTETRDTMSQQGYSASTDLCYIFEKILAEMYVKQEVTTSVLQHVSRHHREWALHFQEGLVTDRISAEENIDSRDKRKLPNIGLCHLKEAYYWTILLITRPYLLEMVQKRVANDSRPLPYGAAKKINSLLPSDSDDLLAHASVNSAVLTIDLLQGLLTAEMIPRRLPFMINSIFNSALVLGLGFFADMNSLFPLGRAMDLAEALLRRFATHDALARWCLRIVKELHNTCDELMKQRSESRLKHQRTLVEGLFGDVKSSCSRVQLFHSTPSSPQAYLERLHSPLAHGTVERLDEISSTEFLSSSTLQESGAIWGQLFRNDSTDPLCELGQEQPDLVYDWV